MADREAIQIGWIKLEAFAEFLDNAGVYLADARTRGTVEILHCV